MRKLSQNKAKKKPDTPLVLVQLIPEECKKKMQNKRNEKWYKTTDAKQSEEKNKIVPINGAEKKKPSSKWLMLKLRNKVKSSQKEKVH